MINKFAALLWIGMVAAIPLPAPLFCTSQEIGWDVCLQNDLWCVEPDVKRPYSTRLNSTCSAADEWEGEGCIVLCSQRCLSVYTLLGRLCQQVGRRWCVGSRLRPGRDQVPWFPWDDCLTAVHWGTRWSRVSGRHWSVTLQTLHTVMITRIVLKTDVLHQTTDDK